MFECASLLQAKIAEKGELLILRILNNFFCFYIFACKREALTCRLKLLEVNNMVKQSYYKT